jgi:hypothetical protein
VAFLQKGLEYAQELLGSSKIPVEKIHLRLSIPVSPGMDLRRNFQLTETTDAEKGIFTIYVSCRPGDAAFFGQLAHEIVHLLNGSLYDAYSEGICTAFAERFLLEQGYDWNRWMAFFDKGGEPFYGTTYHMMKEIWHLVGDRQIGELLTCTRQFSDGSGKMYLDVTNWLATLSEEMQHNVREVIQRYKALIEHGIEISGKQVTFETPNPEHS